jgi:uncharacterized FlaG/YvyC family protein
MNEEQVSGVNRVEVDTASRLSQVRLEMSENSHAQSTAVEKEQMAANASQKQAEPVKANDSEPVVHNSLKFMVDNDTHEVTVLIVDRATQKVVQTIPPEAMKDIPIGQLLQYSV